MRLKRLSVEGVRNLEPTYLHLGDETTLITGANAAGKTSLLEAIHLLGRGRSFRSGRLEQVIRHGKSFLRVTGRVASQSREHRLGIEHDGVRWRGRVDGRDIRALSELAGLFPVQVINTETQRILQDGPAVRRVFLNWGSFHHDVAYQGHWQRYERALRQRNAALRNRDLRLAAAWEPDLAGAGEAVDRIRRALANALETRLSRFVDRWLHGHGVTLAYRSGWRAGESLLGLYGREREREREAGFTLHGPHRADLRMGAMGVEAQHGLSRGQQKLLAISLVLTLCEELHASTQRAPVLLVDDLAAELDRERCAQVLEALEGLSAQVVLTAIDEGDLPLADLPVRRYHLAGGAVQEMI